MLDATLPASLVTPETHLLCLMRSDVQGTQVQTLSICYQSYKPDPPPQLPISDFRPAYHQLAAGGYSPDSGLLLLTVVPCTEFFPGILAVSSGIAIHLDKFGGAASGSTVLTADTTAPFDCADGTASYGDLTLTPLAQSHDEDGDGWCSDWEELGTDETAGGLRDPFNPYDLYDTNGDGVIDLFNDIVGVMNRFGLGVGDQGYDPAYDRGPSVGPYAWNMTAPDGVIDLFNDVVGVIHQFEHDCTP